MRSFRLVLRPLPVDVSLQPCCQPGFDVCSHLFADTQLAKNAGFDGPGSPASPACSPQPVLSLPPSVLEAILHGSTTWLCTTMVAHAAPHMHNYQLVQSMTGVHVQAKNTYFMAPLSQMCHSRPTPSRQQPRATGGSPLQTGVA